MEGMWLKWTNYFTGWQERYFVWKGSLLSYYISKESTLPNGRVHLSVASVSESQDSSNEKDGDKSWEFDWDTGSMVYYLKAEKKEDKIKWMNVWRIAKVEAEKQLKLNLKANANARLNTWTTWNNNNNNNITASNNPLDALRSKYNQIKKKYENTNNTECTNWIKEIDILFLSSNNENDQPWISPKSRSMIITPDWERFYSIDNEDDALNWNTGMINVETQNHSPFMWKHGRSVQIQDDLYNHKRRESLPEKYKPFSFNVWEIFKGAVGKDINRFCVPVFLNEPLSMLQKLCENFQYVDLLNTASIDPDPFMRLAYCAAFCISGFTMNVLRAKKFFNPLLGETYEYIDNNHKFRYFAEQVSHHPAISAFFAEGENWTLFTNNNAHVKFWWSGKLEIVNWGRVYVTFKKFNDNIIFNKPFCMIRNLIFGSLTYDTFGKFSVNNENGDLCEIEIFPSTTGTQGNLNGVVKDVYGEVRYKVEGNFLSSIKVMNVLEKTEKVIWSLIPSSGADSYYFQPFTFDLNHWTEEMKAALPPSDSRFRRDQRWMEYQKISEADEEKHRLEEKQRKKRKENEEKGRVPKPMYFDETYDDWTGELIYRYKGGYFEDRKNKKFEHFPDIFS